MDIFNQILTFGRRVEVYGKTWFLVHGVGQGFYLAVPEDAVLPAPVQLIQLKVPATDPAAAPVVPGTPVPL